MSAGTFGGGRQGPAAQCPHFAAGLTRVPTADTRCPADHDEPPGHLVVPAGFVHSTPTVASPRRTSHWLAGAPTSSRFNAIVVRVPYNIAAAVDGLAARSSLPTSAEISDTAASWRPRTGALLRLLECNRDCAVMNTAAGESVVSRRSERPQTSGVDHLSNGCDNRVGLVQGDPMTAVACDNVPPVSGAPGEIILPLPTLVAEPRR